jgi:hypothetical protein
VFVRIQAVEINNYQCGLYAAEALGFWCFQSLSCSGRFNVNATRPRRSKRP